MPRLAGYAVGALFAAFVAIQLAIGGVVADQRFHDGQFQHQMRDGDGGWVTTNRAFYIAEAYKHQIILLFLMIFLFSVVTRQMRQK